MRFVVQSKVSETNEEYEAMLFTVESKDQVLRWLEASPYWRCDPIGSPETPSIELTLMDGTWKTVGIGMWIVKQPKSLEIFSEEDFHKVFAVLRGREEIPPPERCDKAPAGWVCSRHKGHDGPCAAHQVPNKRRTPIYLTLLICSLQILFSQKGEQCVIVEFEDDNGEKFSAEIVEVDASRLATAIVIRCKTPG